MQALILVAGRGARMGELTNDCPKPLLEVGGLSVLEHKLTRLPKEIDEVVLVTHYRAQDFKEKIGNSYAGHSITYIHQEELNGTAGAVWAAKDVLKDRFLVLMGDDLYATEDLQKMVMEQRCILVDPMDDIFNRAEVLKQDDGTLGEVTETVQEHRPGLVNTGAYTIDQSFFSLTPVPREPGHKEFGLPQTIAANTNTYPYTVVTASEWFQVTSPEDLADAETVLERL